jgi:hypothetical protein
MVQYAAPSGYAVNKVPNVSEYITEKNFQQTLIEVAQAYGWVVYHTWNSRHSAKGFPDLVLLRAGRQIVAELKRVNTKPTVDQLQWLEAFKEAGSETYVWRPSDWDEIHTVLRR